MVVPAGTSVKSVTMVTACREPAGMASVFVMLTVFVASSNFSEKWFDV